MNTDLMFSSKTDLWATPLEFFQKINKVFDFDLDVCALPENAKCESYYTPEVDALTKDWLGVCWMNPPYGRGIDKWVEKAYNEYKAHNSTIVCLLPARTDTRWWHNYCTKGEVHLLKGRLKFGEAKNSAPFPSAVVVFRPTINDALQATCNAT